MIEEEEKTEVPELLQFQVLAFWCQKKEDATCKEMICLISQRMNYVPVWILVPPQILYQSDLKNRNQNKNCYIHYNKFLKYCM